MLRLTFVAHDPGAAQMLYGVVEEARQRKHQIRFIGDGPAGKIWGEKGECVEHLNSADQHQVDQWVSESDLVVTGTGFGWFEKRLWTAFQRRRQKVFAVIDSWSNFKRRFSDDDRPGGLVLPDGIGVVDDWSRGKLADEPWCRVPVYVVGQPHLQRSSQNVRERRERRRPNAKTTVVYFSEPIQEDFQDGSRGFDQFGVFLDMLLQMQADQAYDIIIKPHPREATHRWAELISEWSSKTPHPLALTNKNSDDLLVQADAVVGMTSMVLVEAALSMLPVVSCQPGRINAALPIIDDIVPVVLDMSGFNAELETGLKRGATTHKKIRGLTQVIENSTERFIDVIEAIAS